MKLSSRQVQALLYFCHHSISLHTMRKLNLVTIRSLFMGGYLRISHNMIIATEQAHEAASAYRREHIDVRKVEGPISPSLRKYMGRVTTARRRAA